MPHPALSPSEADDGPDPEASLWSALSTDRAAWAREQIFACHAGFARGLARKIYRQRNMGDLDPADLDQFAYVGLMEAMDRFDPAVGTPFRGFAAARIRGAVIDGITRMSDTREQLAWRHRMRRDRIQSFRLEEQPTQSTDDALAALTELALGLAVGFMLEDTGLFRDGDGTSRHDAYESLAWKDMRNRLHDGLRCLPPREEWIITHHYLRGVAFEQLARLLGLSKGRIAQLHRRALQRLKDFMCGSGHFRLEE